MAKKVSKKNLLKILRNKQEQINKEHKARLPKADDYLMTVTARYK